MGQTRAEVVLPRTPPEATPIDCLSDSFVSSLAKRMRGEERRGKEEERRRRRREREQRNSTIEGEGEEDRMAWDRIGWDGKVVRK